ncbi:MAG: lysophospholipase [Tannerella sp.]|jgi:alpha-beta hydrolase superfamily lysophospholipase|nr:lysophospholipase [Tannerella sp.]
MKYFEQTISSGGIDIVLSVWEASDAKAVIVFVPATMVHPLFYKPLLQGFAERGITVVGVHPVGHGKSSREHKRFTISDIIENARDAVSFALTRYDGLPVVAMGSSQGGIVASALAAEDERLAAAFCHNVMLTELPDSIRITRFPAFLRHVYKPLKSIFRCFVRLLPDLQLPLGFYLERKRISADPTVWEAVDNDPLCLKTYSLHFLASLFTTRFKGLTDGSIRCPLYIISDNGDRLFSKEYTTQIFNMLQAPCKEMLTFNFNDHMLLFTHPQDVCERLAAKIHEN